MFGILLEDMLDGPRQIGLREELQLDKSQRADRIDGFVLLDAGETATQLFRHEAANQSMTGIPLLNCVSPCGPPIDQAQPKAG